MIEAEAMLSGMPTEMQASMASPDIMHLLGAADRDDIEEEEEEEEDADDDEEEDSLDEEEFALFEAVEEGDLDEVARLLASGVSANTSDPRLGNLSVLMSSASSPGAGGAWKLLLEQGAEPNLVDDDGGTALLRACMMGNDEQVLGLLAKGAIVGSDFSGANPFDYKHKLMAATIQALREADDTGCEDEQQQREEKREEDEEDRDPRVIDLR